DGEMRVLTGPASPTTALLRADASDVREADEAVAVVINPDLINPHPPSIGLDPPPPAAGADFGRLEPFDGDEPGVPLAPGDVRLLLLHRSRQVKSPDRHARRLLQAAPTAPRIVIDKITPAVDAGRFAAKRIVGENIRVEADIFTDGHDVLGAEL